MKLFVTLMLMLVFGLSVAYSQDFSDDDASLDAQQFVDRVLKGQVVDEDDEIVDMDDALRKLRLLRKVYRIVAEVEGEDSLHPRKRFLKKKLAEIKNVLKEAWNKAKNAFDAAVSALKEHVDFDAIAAKVIPQIHSDMTVAGCVATVIAGATAILGPAASIAGTIAKPICEGSFAYSNLVSIFGESMLNLK